MGSGNANMGEGCNVHLQRKSESSTEIEPMTLKSKWYHAKVLLKRFHLNEHTIVRKSELHVPIMSPELTLVLEGLKCP